MELSLVVTIAIAIIGVLVLSHIVRIVPQNEAYIVERLGKYNATLEAGFHILIPFIDQVSYKHSLKEFAIDVPSQQAITKDNVSLGIDGVLYMRIMDPRAASYGVENLSFAVMQLAQTSMRAEIGKLTLDQTFESRDNINGEVTQAIDEASNAWGTKVLRYEVRDISPPSTILDEMEKQMSAERERRVAVTTSEGYKTAQINEAEGDKQAKILRAEGDAQAVEIEAEARAKAIETIAAAIKNGGEAAVAQQLSEQYIDAFEKLAREGTVALIPTDSSDVSSVIAKAFTAFDTLKTKVSQPANQTAIKKTGYESLLNEPRVDGRE
jgi:regulator of protease activity HflC (stomatin/prohibitin superfamily)